MPAMERRGFDVAEDYIAARGTPVIVSQWGADFGDSRFPAMADLFDEHTLGYAVWTYAHAEPDWAVSIIRDANKPPTGANLRDERLAALDRPYPHAVAGTPTAWPFDPAQGVFELPYGTEPAAGQLAGGATTEIHVPERYYPNGYSVTVGGGAVVDAGSPTLVTVKNSPGADTVRVSVPIALSASRRRATTGGARATSGRAS